jgi:glucosamine--fructose-6-phosphate aminotransferase (isomerizing)
MCGIVGIVSQKGFPTSLLLRRLKRLEYRGYDSFGYYDGRELRKAVGSIAVGGGCGLTRAGISHTRWATHGGVTEANAHPHASCDDSVVIVHNGIIENFEEIRKNLLRKGHRFASETDSEVISHYFEEGLKTAPIRSVMVDFLKTAKGTFAALVMVKGHDEIYAVKRDSPLVLGVADGMNIVASDIYAFSDITTQAGFFENDEFAVIQDDGFQFFDRRGRAVDKPLRTFPKQQETSSRKSYRHFMMKEILEEPEAVDRLLFSLGHDQKPAFDRLVRLVRRSKKIIFASCGTSYHASLLGAYFLHRVGVENQTLIASEFRHFANVDRDTLIIAISQSGETMDVIDALNYARECGGRVASLVNVPYSTIQRMSELSLNLLAGQEVCVASTKAFVSQTAFMLRLAQEFGFRVNLANLADRIRGLLRQRGTIREIAESIAGAKDVYVIGRGLTYPVAREIALKIKEISYIHAEGMMGGELKHGTIALIEEGTPVISLINNSDPDIISNTKEVEARGAKAIAITNNPAFRKRAGAITVKTDNDGKFGILAAVAGQLIAYYAADKLGRPIDKPRNLAKSVTVK